MNKNTHWAKWCSFKMITTIKNHHLKLWARKLQECHGTATSEWEINQGTIIQLHNTQTLRWGKKVSSWIHRLTFSILMFKWHYLTEWNHVTSDLLKHDVFTKLKYYSSTEVVSCMCWFKNGQRVSCTCIHHTSQLSRINDFSMGQPPPSLKTSQILFVNDSQSLRSTSIKL